MRQLFAQRLRQVGGRIGRRQKHLMAAGGEFRGDRGGHRRLADAALAHQHDQAFAGPFDFIDQRAERAEACAAEMPLGRVPCCRYQRARRVQSGRKASMPTRFSDRNGKIFRGSRARSASIAADGCLILLDEGGGERVAAASAAGITPLIASCWFADTDAASSRDVRAASASAESMRAGDQNEPGCGRVCEPIDGRGVTRALLLKARERAEAGRIALARLQKAVHAPGSFSSRMVWPVGAVSKMT